MKKIALLFTLILCAGALNGMEKPDWNILPKDVQGVIIKTAFETNNNLNDTIKTIEAMVTLQGVQYNLKYFTRLVHLLGDKFNITTVEAAEKFTMPVAKKYIELVEALKKLIKNQDEKNRAQKLAELIAQGVDINYSEKILWVDTALTKAVRFLDASLVNLILKEGADPEYKMPPFGLTALDYVLSQIKQKDCKDDYVPRELYEIRDILKNTMTQK